jgi:RND family efflux transporter MFP subunit
MDPEKLAQLKIQRQDSAALKPVRRWKRLLLISILAGTGLLAFYLYRQGLLSPAATVRLTAVSLIYPSQVITDLNASGYVVAQQKAAVSSKGTGRLDYLGVEEGSRVKKGDMLARLENSDLEAELNQAKAQLAASRASLDEAASELRTAQRNWERYKDLWERHLISLADYDTATDRYRKAQGALQAAQANIKAFQAAVERASVLIEYTLIRAPFDGVVLTKDADVGEVVAPFGSATNARAAVVTMADLASLMVEADVAEAFLPKVYADQPCEIQLDALPQNRFPGKVEIIVPTADRTKGTVQVKVRFDSLDPRILPEMSSRVAFLSRPLTDQEKEPRLTVHRDALTKRDDTEGIFLKKDDEAEWVPLPAVTLLGDYVVLPAPFQAGEQAVLKPALTLRPGARIKVAE